MRKKNVIVFGASGQDGSLISKLLRNKGCNVLAVSNSGSKKNFRKLKIENNIKLIKIDIYNKSKIKQLIKRSKCSEIYYFAGQSSLQQSFVKIIETFKSHNLPLYNILYEVMKLNKKIKIFNACSGLIYDRKEKTIKEDSKLKPNSPYAFSKLVSYFMVKYFRENHGLWCCSGLFFNHESELRPNYYVIKKITNYLKYRNKRKLKLGNINTAKDWGWAPEYMEIVYKILQKKKPKDLIIATGKVYKLKNVLKMAFLKKNLDWKNFVQVKKNLFRQSDMVVNKINVSSLNRHIGQIPKIDIPEILKLMLYNKN